MSKIILVKVRKTSSSNGILYLVISAQPTSHSNLGLRTFSPSNSICEIPRVDQNVCRVSLFLTEKWLSLVGEET